MRNNLLDEASAAEIIGVERSTVFGWCKNNIINCTDAPKEYKDKTQFLIAEAECNYIASLIAKFGARKALLNYNKMWKDTSHIRTETTAEVIVDVTLDNSSRLKTRTKDCEPERKIINSDKLVSSILFSHVLKEKINHMKNELTELENEYAKLKDEIITQL